MKMTDEQLARDNEVIDRFEKLYGPVMDMPDSIFYVMQQVREIVLAKGF